MALNDKNIGVIGVSPKKAMLTAFIREETGLTATNWKKEALAAFNWKNCGAYGL